MKRLNIVEIIWHDLGKFLPCYGYNSITAPNLSRFASEGLVFDNFYCTSPICSPSRGSIMTGKYPHNNGLVGLVHRGWRLNKEQYFLPDFLNKAGYQTALFGFQHEAPHGQGEELGYQYTIEGESEKEDVPGDTNYKPDVATWFNKWLDNKRDIAKPFFASIGLRLVHRPHSYGAFEKGSESKINIPYFLPDDPDIRRDLAGFYSLITMADKIVGDVLHIIAENNLKDETLVLFTSDHGADYPGAKSSLYDAGINVASIIRYPQKPENPHRTNKLVSNIDILPTFLEIAGAEVPDSIQGKSFLPLLLGNSYKPRTEIFAERTWQGLYDPIRCIRTEQFKLIHNFLPDKPLLIAPEFIKNIGKEKAEKYFTIPRPEYELYDLEKDPYEKNNFFSDQRYSDIKDDLISRLNLHLESTDDPIIKGPIPHPGRHDDVWDWRRRNGKWELYDMKENN